MLSSLLVLAALHSAAPQLVVQSGHGGSIDQIALSPNGKILATTSPAELRLWDLDSGLLLRAISLQSCSVARLAFLPGGKAVAAGGSCEHGEDTFDSVVDLETGAVKTFQALGFAVRADADFRGGYTPDGRLLLQPRPKWLGKPAAIEVWSLADGKKLRDLPADEFLDNRARIYGLGPNAFTLCRNGEFSFFDLEKGQPLSGHAPLKGVDCSFPPALSPDGKVVALKTSDNGVTIQPEGGGERRVIVQRRMHHLAFAPGGKLLLAGNSERDGRHAWTSTVDLSTDKEEQFVEVTARDAWGAWLVGEERIVGISKDDQLSLSDRKTGALQRELGGNPHTLRGLAFSPNGRFLAQAAIKYDTKIEFKIWDLSTGHVVRAFTSQELAQVEQLAFTPDGEELAWAEFPWDGDPAELGLRLINVKTGEQRRLAQGRLVRSFSFARGGKWLAVAGRKRGGQGSARGTGAVLDTATGQELFALPGVSEVALSEDGAFLVAGAPFDSTEGALYSTTQWQKLKSIRWTNAFPSRDLRQLANAPLWTDQGYGIDLGPLAAPEAPAPAAKPARKGKREEDPPKHSLDVAHHVWCGAFSPDGALFATGGTGEGGLFEVKTLKKVRDFQPDHPVELEALAYSRDGKWIATGGQEGSVVLRDGRTGAPIATLLTRNETDGMIVLTSGEYLASKGALGAIAFRSGAHAYPFEQFDLKFNRPDVVLKTLGKSAPALIDAVARARAKRLQRAGFTEESLSAQAQLPELTLDRAALPASTAADAITLAVTARSQGALLDRLLVTVDDTPFDGKMAGLDLRPRQAKSVTESVTVPVLPGRNRVQLSVLDANGVESLRETIEVRGEGAPKPGKLFLLATGVSKYKDPAYELHYAAKDAQDLAALFAHAPHLASGEIVPVLDDAATREGIVAAREKLLQAGPGDEVVIFLAGHGLLDDKLDYYFATTDIDFEHPAARGLSFDDLEGLLDGVKARRKLLLMDTCNSGELDKGDVEVAALTQAAGDPRVKARAVGNRGLKRKSSLGTDDLSALLNELFADTRRGSGAVAISSAGGAEFALESDEWKNGVFTFALLESLRTGSADKNKDGTVTASELREAVQTRVRELTAGRQSPTSRRENLAVDFAVY